MSSTTPAPLPASDMSQRAESVMMNAFARLPAESHKSSLKLSIGDPTYDGNFAAPPEAGEAFAKFSHVPTVYSYQPVWGRAEAREAVAQYWSRHFAAENAAECLADHVVLAAGGSEAIVLTLVTLCSEGDNLLVPAPGFPEYANVCRTYQFEPRRYQLMPGAHWEVDLKDVRRQVDDRTKAIVLNNPSNPCGSNWSRTHIENIVKLAEELRLPIVSDEIYAGMVFEGQAFTSMAALKTSVPRFIIGGTAKNFVAPGWRFGWTLVVDPEGYAEHALKGLRNIGMMHLGASALIQHAAPHILGSTPPEYFTKLTAQVKDNAFFFAESVRRCHGLSSTSPQGALYLMIKVHLDQFPRFANEIEFCHALEDEENVQVTPGTYLQMPGYFRVCITRTPEVIKEVAQRLTAFCERHKP